MAGLLLADLEALVRDLCFEGADDTGLFTQTRLQAFIQIAHRDLYSFVSTLSPNRLLKRSADVSITSTGLSLAGTTIDSAGIDIVKKFELKDPSGNYVSVLPVDVTEVSNSDGPLTTGDRDITGFLWSLVGRTIYLVPKPSLTYTARLHYVPGPTDISSIAYPFGGAFPQFDHLVGYRAADLALTKDEKPSAMHGTYMEMKREFGEYLRRPHVFGPRRVRMSAYSEE